MKILITGPITVTKGTNELAKPGDVDRLLAKVLSGTCKKGKVPSLGDGCTAPRIAFSLKKRSH